MTKTRGKAKNANGEGGITYREDGRYMGRYTVHTATGSRRRVVYGKTRKEAHEKLVKALADRDKDSSYRVRTKRFRHT